MEECRKFQLLTTDAAATNLRVRRLLETSERLPAITGLSGDALFELIVGALAEKRNACNTLISHVEFHECSSARCTCPAPVCDGCFFLGKDAPLAPFAEGRLAPDRLLCGLTHESAPGPQLRPLVV
jgi:hypothetical protein